MRRFVTFPGRTWPRRPNPRQDPAEECDGLDNACVGTVPDEDADTDGDGLSICDGDCNDTDGQINPDAVERCNGVDDDCDGEVDGSCPTGDTGVKDSSDGCGCSAMGSSGAWSGLVLPMAWLIRLRRAN
jgi:hypothetical protein